MQSKRAKLNENKSLFEQTFSFLISDLGEGKRNKFPQNEQTESKKNRKYFCLFFINFCVCLPLSGPEPKPPRTRWRKPENSVAQKGNMFCSFTHLSALEFRRKVCNFPLFTYSKITKIGSFSLQHPSNRTTLTCGSSDFMTCSETRRKIRTLLVLAMGRRRAEAPRRL